MPFAPSSQDPSSSHSCSIRYLSRDIKSRRRSLRSAASLPNLRLVPSDRPLFVCQQCSSANIYVSTCPWCRWSSQKTSEEFEHALRLHKIPTISCPQLRHTVVRPGPRSSACSDVHNKSTTSREPRSTWSTETLANPPKTSLDFSDVLSWRPKLKSGWSFNRKHQNRKVPCLPASPSPPSPSLSRPSAPSSPSSPTRTLPVLRPRYSARTLACVPPYLLPPPPRVGDSPGYATPTQATIAPSHPPSPRIGTRSNPYWSRKRPLLQPMNSHATIRADCCPPPAFSSAFAPSPADVSASASSTPFASPRASTSSSSTDQDPAYPVTPPNLNKPLPFIPCAGSTSSTDNSIPMPPRLKIFFTPIDPLTGSPFLPPSPSHSRLKTKPTYLHLTGSTRSEQSDSSPLLEQHLHFPSPFEGFGGSGSRSATESTVYESESQECGQIRTQVSSYSPHSALGSASSSFFARFRSASPSPSPSGPISSKGEIQSPSPASSLMPSPISKQSITGMGMSSKSSTGRMLGRSVRRLKKMMSTSFRKESELLDANDHGPYM